MISSRTGALSLSIACLFSMSALTAQKGQLKDALPADSLLYISFPDIPSSLRELREMPVGKMWQEGEVQDFFADGLKFLEERMEQGLAQGGEIPFSLKTLLGLQLKSVAIGVTSISLEMPEGASEPQPNFGVYTLVDFGDTAATWRQIFQGLIAKATEEAGDMITVSTSKVGDIELLTIAPAGQESSMSLNVAFFGDSVLIGTRTGETGQLIANLMSGEKQLSASADYQQILTRLMVPGAESEFYFQPSAIIDLILDAVGLIDAHLDAGSPDSLRDKLLNPAGIERVITALGLRAFKGCGSSSTYTDGHCVTRGYVQMDPELRRGLTAFTESNLDLGFLRWVPKDAVAFSASTIDLGAYYDALTKGLEALDPEMDMMVMSMLQGFEQQLGVSLRDDLFGSFGDHFITWSMPMSGLGATPEMSILIRVKDEQRLMKALKVAETMSQGYLELDEIDRRGFKAHQLHLSMPNSGGFMAMNPLDMFTPTFVFQDGYMVIGFTTGDVKRTLKRMAREDDPSGDIRSNEEFSPYLSKLPKQGISSLTFTDWKAQFEGFYQAATMGLAFLPMSAEIPIDLALLPDSYSLTQHLCGSISWVMSTVDGQESMSISPWGPETTMTLGFAATAGLGAALLAGATRLDLGGK